MNTLAVRTIAQTVHRMPFGAGIGPSYDKLTGAATEAEVLDLLADYLQALRSRLSSHAESHAAMCEELDRLRADRAAVRRFFGVITEGVQRV